jgi:putative SOS response-associated peptidase YedK
MCGRYVVIATFEEIEVRFYVDTKEIREHWMDNRNIGVGSKAIVITNEAHKIAQLFTFGLTPSWANKKMYFFNARSEGDSNKEDDPHYSGGKGIISKPSFRKAIRSQRCLIPANGFIEGPKGTKDVKPLDKPFYCYLREEPIFALAGIWDKWVDTATGEVEQSFAIVTTVANELMQKIGHHRMPVILSRAQEQLWLDTNAPLSDITRMLEPYPAKEMNAFPISSRIKNPRVNDAELLQPTGPLVFAESHMEKTSSLVLQGMGNGKRNKRDNDWKPTLGESAGLEKQDKE